MKSKATASYVFCIVRAAKAPALPAGVGGLPLTGRPRAVSAGKGVWLILADAPLSVYGEAALNERLKDLDWVSRCALAHEAVIEAVSRAPAVLPLKLFTLFNSDERAKALVDRAPAKISRALDRVEGCAEFGVRLSLDEGRARRAVEARSRTAGAATKGQGGAAFLLRKKTLKEASQELTRGSREAGEELFKTLSGLAQDTHRRTDVEGLAPGSRLVMDGVFLVGHRQAARFKAAVRGAAKDLEERGYDLVLNGPWPAYHFVTEAA